MNAEHASLNGQHVYPPAAQLLTTWNGEAIPEGMISMVVPTLAVERREQAVLPEVGARGARAFARQLQNLPPEPVADASKQPA
jgi:hypothetical protein